MEISKKLNEDSLVPLRKTAYFCKLCDLEITKDDTVYIIPGKNRMKHNYVKDQIEITWRNCNAKNIFKAINGQITQA